MTVMWDQMCHTGLKYTVYVKKTFSVLTTTI